MKLLLAIALAFMALTLPANAAHHHRHHHHHHAHTVQTSVCKPACQKLYHEFTVWLWQHEDMRAMLFDDAPAYRGCACR
jgi:hypothetical protein